MPLKVVLGEKKSGKTSFVFSGLKKSKDGIIIVPEQTLFLYEKEVLDKLSEEHSFNVQILSFKKLARKIFKNDKNYNRVKLLDRDTKNLIIEKILLSNKDKLSSFKNAAQTPELSEKIASQIGEFKKYLLTNDDILKLSENEKINKNLKDKLCDLSFIYSLYEEKIKNIYSDVDDLIKSASDKIIEENLFSGKDVFIDSFTGFTGDEIYMIKALVKNKANVYITLPYTEGRWENFGDLGYTVKNTRNKLLKLCESLGEKFEETNLGATGIENSEIKFLIDNFDNNKSTGYTDKAECISITKCRNIKYECDNLTSQIIKLIKEKNASLCDIAVVVPDIKEYVTYIREAFLSFNLSFYSNEKKSVYDMPVSALLCNIFSIILSGNRMDVIIGYLKSGYFFKDEQDKIYKFEEFLRKTGIRAYQLMKKPFLEILNEKKLYNFKIEDEESLVEVYNKAVLPVIKLKENIEKGKTSKDYSLFLYDYFKEIELDKTLMAYVEEYKKDEDLVKGQQLVQVYNYILESMERTTLILSETNVSFKEYKNIIIASLKNKNIASIPILSDSIFITQPSSFFNDSYKYIFVMGANEGKLPALNFSEGIINEEERNELKELGFELSMSAELKMMEENLKLYDIITSPDNELYISYSLYSKGGTEQIASSFVQEIAGLFSLSERGESIEYKSKRTLLKDILASFSSRKIYYEKEMLDYLCYDEEYLKIIKETLHNLSEPGHNDISVSGKNMKKLLGDRLNVSTTNIEKYNSCAFSYFIRYVLRAKENEKFSINSANLGSVMHLILEKFSNKLKGDNMDFSQIDDSYINKNLKAIIDSSSKEVNNGVFNSDVKGEVFKAKLWATAYKTLNLLRKHFVKGSFKTIGFEMDFGRADSEIEGIAFDVGEGRKVVLNGVIDRVDKFEKDDEEYIRIVDYKSSEKTLDFYEVVTGLKMQLAVYLMNAIGSDGIKKIKPGGMLYLSLKSPMVSVLSPADTDTIEARIKDKLTMKGFYLNTNTIVEAMDIDLKDNRKSDIVDLEISSSGIPKNKNTLSLDEFNTLLGFVKKNIESGGANIFSGKFPIKPISDKGITSCEYCPYSSVCMFDSEISETVNIRKIPRDEIFCGGNDGRN